MKFIRSNIFNCPVKSNKKVGLCCPHELHNSKTSGLDHYLTHNVIVNAQVETKGCLSSCVKSTLMFLNSHPGVIEEQPDRNRKM